MEATAAATTMDAPNALAGQEPTPEVSAPNPPAQTVKPSVPPRLKAPTARMLALERAWAQALEREREARQRDWLMLGVGLLAGVMLLAMLAV